MNKRAAKKIPYLHERDGSLYVRVPYRSGRKWRSKERRVESRDEALSAIQEIKVELGMFGPSAFDGERMTFDQLFEEYARAYPGSRPGSSNRDIFTEYFSGRRLRSITYADCKRFKAARQAHVSTKTNTTRKSATINRELEQLRAILFYALHHGWIRFNPFTAGPPLISKAEETRRDRVPTPEEERRILAHCVKPREHLRGLIIATRDTGLRRSALQALTWSMIDFENRLIRCPAGNVYKQRPALIGISDRLFNELVILFNRSDRAEDSLIFDHVKDFKRSYATACRLAGVSGLRFNDFRHGFATDLMEAGVPLHLAMKLAGHTNPTTHDIYTNVDARLALEVKEKLNRLHEARNSSEDFPALDPVNGYLN
jgi:integrase